MTRDNSLLAHLECSFQGKAVTLESVIDLDLCLATPEDEPDWHLLLARAGGIDPYSYLYEVLESEDIRFSAPTGLATDCLIDGRFDWCAFVQAVRDAQDSQVIAAIAAREMQIHDLSAHGELKAALLAAFRAGKSHGR
jgi:hypothetical protein